MNCPEYFGLLLGMRASLNNHVYRGDSVASYSVAMKVASLPVVTLSTDGVMEAGGSTVLDNSWNLHKSSCIL